MLRLSLICFSFCFIFYHSLAQIPGYAGARTILSVDVQAFPTVLQALEGNPLRLNVWPNLSLERVMSRRASVGLTIQGFETQLPYSYENREGTALLRGAGLGLFWRSYAFQRRGHLAPLGFFQQVEIAWLQYRLTDVSRQFYLDARPNLGRYPDIRLAVTLGSQRVLHPRLVLHWGLQTAWLFDAFAPIEPLFPVEAVFIHQRATARLRGIFALNLKAGIGILLF